MFPIEKLQNIIAIVPRENLKIIMGGYRVVPLWLKKQVDMCDCSPGELYFLAGQ